MFPLQHELERLNATYWHEATKTFLIGYSLTVMGFLSCFR